MSDDVDMGNQEQPAVENQPVDEAEQSSSTADTSKGTAAYNQKLK